MLFVPKCSQVVFLDCRTLNKKDGKGTFTVVKIADPSTYENIEAFVNSADVPQFQSLQSGELIEVAIDYDGRFTYLKRTA